MVCADTTTYCKASTSLTITDATETHLQTSLISAPTATLWPSFQTVLTQAPAPNSPTSANPATPWPSFQTILTQVLVPTSPTSATTAIH